MLPGLSGAGGDDAGGGLGFLDRPDACSADADLAASRISPRSSAASLTGDS